MAIRDYQIPITTRQNPLAGYNQLRPYKDGKEKITPEICLDFLQSSDNNKVIGELLEIITKELEKLPQSYSQYQKILLGCLIERDCRENNVQKIAEIQHRFSKIENANLAEYILVATLAEFLETDKSQELKQIISYLTKEDAAAIAKELEYQTKINQVKTRQQKILKQAKQESEGKEVIKGELSEDKRYSNTRYFYKFNSSLEFSKETEGIYISDYLIPQKNNLSELKNLKTFWSDNVDFRCFVLKLPQCTEHIIFMRGHIPEELDLTPLTSLKSFHLDGADISDAKSIMFPYQGRIDELIIFNMKQLPNEFDLSVLCYVDRLRIDTLFKEHDNCRLPKNIGSLELTRLTVDSGVIDFSSIETAEYLEFEETMLGENVEIRFPQTVKKIKFKNCVIVPKQLNLDINGLEEVVFCDNDYNGLEKIILPKNIDRNKVILPEILNLKVRFGTSFKPNLLNKLFFKTKNR